MAIFGGRGVFSPSKKMGGTVGVPAGVGSVRLKDNMTYSFGSEPGFQSQVTMMPRQGMNNPDPRPMGGQMQQMPTMQPAVMPQTQIAPAPGGMAPGGMVPAQMQLGRNYNHLLEQYQRMQERAGQNPNILTRPRYDRVVSGIQAFNPQFQAGQPAPAFDPNGFNRFDRLGGRGY